MEQENEKSKSPEEETLLPKTENDPKVKPEEDIALEGSKECEKKENGDTKSRPEEYKKSPVRRLSQIVVDLYNSGETACGVGYFKGRLLQVFANKKSYVIVYGFLGCFLAACNSYFNGTVTTLEKRFKIPSTNSGIILASNDVGSAAVAFFLTYYGASRHRPRLVACGTFGVLLYCILNALPHFLYGPGEDALGLTLEFGGQRDENTTAFLIDAQNRKLLCQDEDMSCDDSSGSFAPQVILFIAQVICGVGSSMYFCLGFAYLDDNMKKSRTPALASFAFFLRMMGPAAGYAIASACLRMYIAPSLTPSIGMKDPRWLGAWWLGWFILGSGLFVASSMMMLFPKSLPRAAARRVLAAERLNAGLDLTKEQENTEEPPKSLYDMKITLMRLVKNKIYLCNSLASVFYIFGYTPYWIFLPKYIETIFKQSASVSSFITGSVGLIFTAIGVLVSGVIISKVKPKARYLAAWNVIVGFYSVMGIISYSLLNCPVNDRQGTMLTSGEMDMNTPCNADCHCNYVKYTPVCSPDGRTFISPCHAGCTDYAISSNGSKVYKNCECALRPPRGITQTANLSQLPEEEPWLVSEGPCPVDCSTNLYIFIFIVCTIKFSGASARTSNVLVSVRCVEEKDKSVSMGLGMVILSLFAFIPSPIVFGYIIDKTCMVWGKTCTGTGNCWLYNGEVLRYLMHYVAAGFVSIAVMFDTAVWYYVKDLKVFDEEIDQLDFSQQKVKTIRK